MSQTIQSGKYRIYYNDSWYSNDDAPLLLLRNITSVYDKDSLGSFKKISLEWKFVKRKTWITSFKCYNNFVVFEQSFPKGLEDVPGRGRDMDTPSTAFPSFLIDTFEAKQMVTFFGQNAAQNTRYGTFQDSYVGGYLGGPIGIFDSITDRTSPAAEVIVISSLTHHLLAVHNLNPNRSAGTQGDILEFGVQGLLHNIPQNFSIEFLFYIGRPRPTNDKPYAGNISRVFLEWGELLIQKSHGKTQRTKPDANTWISHLGYSTTGVYHYNPCDCYNNPFGWGCTTNTSLDLCYTYEDNIKLVYSEGKKKKIPFKWILLDSWWHAYNNQSPPQNLKYSLYFEDIDEQVGAIFPHGLKELQDFTNTEFGAHWSSSFSPKTPYRKIGNWECGIDKLGNEIQCIPLADDSHQDAFEFIFNANLDWNMSVLKMDHVFDVAVGSKAGDPNCGHSDGSICKPGERNASIEEGSVIQILSQAEVGELYLDGLSNAALRNGISIMLCMSYPNVIMHSVNSKAFTHGRGSSDSHTRHNTHGFPYDNWQGFGGESMFLWAVGLWPFKDTFYSNSSSVVRNKFAEDFGGHETLVFTQALVSALSGGGFSDGGPIHDADAFLLSMSCDSGGTLLKPSVPAMYIDRVWCGDQSVGETSVASATISGFVWRYVSIIRNTAFLLKPTDVGIDDNKTNKIYFWCSSWQKYTFCDITLYKFDSTNPLQIPSSNWTKTNGSEAIYVLVTPELNGGWVLVGEVDKFIAVSPYRFQKIVSNSTTFIANLKGQPNEMIQIRMVSPGGSFSVYRCFCSKLGKVTMVVAHDGRLQCL